jgi:hypothetical protein
VLVIYNDAFSTEDIQSVKWYDITVNDEWVKDLEDGGSDQYFPGETEENHGNSLWISGNQAEFEPDSSRIQVQNFTAALTSGLKKYMISN